MYPQLSEYGCSGVLNYGNDGPKPYINHYGFQDSRIVRLLGLGSPCCFVTRAFRDSWSTRVFEVSYLMDSRFRVQGFRLEGSRFSEAWGSVMSSRAGCRKKGVRFEVKGLSHTYRSEP